MRPLTPLRAGIALIRKYPDLSAAIALGCLMLTAVLLSVFFFIGQSLRLDEAQSLWQSSRTPLGVLHIVGEDVHVPLYQELLHFWRLFVGDTVAKARGLSLVFFMLSIPALYALGKLVYSRSIGLFAAVLFTISPFINWYGNEIRMYTLFVFFVIINQYFFICLFKKNNSRTWFWYGLTAVLGMYSHYFFSLVLFTHLIFYGLNVGLFPQGSFKRFVLTASIVVGSLVPWVLYVIHIGKAASQSPHLPVPTTVDLFNIFAQFISGFQSDPINTVFLSLWPLALLFGFFGLRRNARTTDTTHFLMLSVLVPLFTAYFISIFIVPVFISRYLIVMVPALYLCILSLIETYSYSTAVIARSVLVGFMLIMLGFEITSPITPVKEHYKEVAAFLNEHAMPQDAVILSAPFTLYPIEYYYRAPTPLTTLPIWNQFETGTIPQFNATTLPAEVTTLTQHSQNAWVLLSYDQGYESQIHQYFETHYALVYQKQFSPGLSLYEYRIRYDTPLSR
jgi:mannosyltransferase